MNQINFTIVIVAENCNPNGDPLMGNRPRIDLEGYGEISDVCLKRKIRNRLQDMGENILIVQNDRIEDGLRSVKKRIDSVAKVKDALTSNNPEPAHINKLVCEEWTDVRFFGQVFASKKIVPSGITIGVRGPVTIQIARTLEEVRIKEYLIARSINMDEDGKRDSSTMGKKYTIEKGVYVTHGSICPELAEKVGFTEKDAEKLKQCLTTLFDGDASAARPSGSLEVAELYWWKQKEGAEFPRHSPIKVHRSVRLTPRDEFPYYRSEVTPLEGLEPEIYKIL